MTASHFYQNAIAWRLAFAVLGRQVKALASEWQHKPDVQDGTQKWGEIRRESERVRWKSSPLDNREPPTFLLTLPSRRPSGVPLYNYVSLKRSSKMVWKEEMKMSLTLGLCHFQSLSLKQSRPTNGLPLALHHCDVLNLRSNYAFIIVSVSPREP